MSPVPSRFDVGDVPRAGASSVRDCDLSAGAVGPDDDDGDVVAWGVVVCCLASVDSLSSFAYSAYGAIKGPERAACNGIRADLRS